MVDDAKREITGLSLGQELLLYLYKMCTKRQLSSKSNKKVCCDWKIVCGMAKSKGSQKSCWHQCMAKSKEAKSPAGTNGDSGNFIC